MLNTPFFVLFTGQRRPRGTKEYYSRTFVIFFKIGIILEGPAFLVSRELPSACEQKSRWAYNAFCVTELAKGKRYLDQGGDEATGLRKSWKPT